MSFGRPGVYIRERVLPAPIAPNSTANAVGAAIGKFASGPESPTLVTSWFDFVRRFGGYNSAFPATFGVGQFFRNGGTQLYVQRVLAEDAVAASVAIPSATVGEVGTVTAKNRGSDGNNLRVRFVGRTGGRYDLEVYLEDGVDPSTDDDVLLERFTNVVLDDALSSDYVSTVVEQESDYVTVVINDAELAPTNVVLPLVGGDNGDDPTSADFISKLPGLDVIRNPLVIFAPEVVNDLGAVEGPLVHEAIVSWASSNNGFAVIDTPKGLDVDDALDYATGIGSTSAAAVYYPNIYIPDPLGRNSASRRLVGPAGSVAGLYLATDLQFGPFKSPAGLRSALGGAVAIERPFTNAELDQLNSAAFPLNAIRDVPGSGVVVMGARTLQQDGTANRYVATRRSLSYIRNRLSEIAEFALFESNDERLWGRLRTSIGVFLNEYRNQGGLRGETPEQAFFVKVDADNNTPQSIANGEVNIQVGVALEYPAEFIVITLSQRTGE
jgi:uncharacterized protein